MTHVFHAYVHVFANLVQTQTRRVFHPISYITAICLRDCYLISLGFFSLDLRNVVNSFVHLVCNLFLRSFFNYRLLVAIVQLSQRLLLAI